MTPSAACPRTPARRALAGRGRPPKILLLVALAVGLVGCLTLDSTLAPDGSGTLDMTYRTRPYANAAAEKRLYSSEHVIVDSLSFTDASTAVLKAHFDDVTKLSTAEGFNDVTITRTRDGDDERLAIHIVNPEPIPIPDKGQPGPKITLHLPGPVREANNDAKVAGDTVTWSFTLTQWAQAKTTDLTVRYGSPAPKAKTDGAEAPAKDKAPAKDQAPAKKDKAPADKDKAPPK